MSNYSKEFLRKTAKIWQPYSPVSISSKNAREIVDSMTGLFSLLLKWEQKDRGEERNLFKPNRKHIEDE